MSVTMDQESVDKSSNKIINFVSIQQLFKKWKNLACKNKVSPNPSNSKKGPIKFLKKSLSFTDWSSQSDGVCKGFLAVCVGNESKRFVIPTEHLRHEAFRILLREAEEEFGFNQQGVLKIPCKVSVFQQVLKIVEEKKKFVFLPDQSWFIAGSISSPNYPQMYMSR